MDNNRLSYIEIICAAVMWGSIGTFVTTLSALGFSSVQLVSVRILLTLVILFFYILLTDRRKLRIDLRDIWMFLGSGILSFVCFNLCYFTSIKLTGLCTAAILLYTAPVFVAIMSRIFFREKLTANKLAALPMALAGCALVSGIASGGSYNAVGIICGLACGFGYALYSIFGRVALKKYSSQTVTFYTFVCASVAILPFSHITEVPALIKAPSTALLLLGLAVVTNLLPYSLYTAGLARIDASKASVIACIEPVVASLIGIFVYGEQAGPLRIAGIILVMAAVVVINLDFTKFRFKAKTV